MTDDVGERLKQLFAMSVYEKHSFRMSMGEIGIEAAGFKTLMGFLAQGVAQAGYEDDRYLHQLIGVHGHLTGMIEDLQKKPGSDLTSRYHYSLILGVLIEMAVEAVQQLQKEDRGD